MTESITIYYGSRKLGRDLDLFVIQQAPAADKSMEVGLLDLAVMSEIEFMRCIQLFDPAVTEPLLTGSLLCGKKQTWNRYRETLQKFRPTSKCIAYLKTQANKQFCTAADMLELAIQTNTPYYSFLALKSISWSISYLSFAQYYADKSSPVCSFKTMATKDRLLFPKFWFYFRSLKERNMSIEFNRVEEWLDCLKGLFI